MPRLIEQFDPSKPAREEGDAVVTGTVETELKKGENLSSWQHTDVFKRITTALKWGIENRNSRVVELAQKSAELMAQYPQDHDRYYLVRETLYELEKILKKESFFLRELGSFGGFPIKVSVDPEEVGAQNRFHLSFGEYGEGYTTYGKEYPPELTSIYTADWEKAQHRQVKDEGGVYEMQSEESPGSISGVPCMVQRYTRSHQAGKCGGIIFSFQTLPETIEAIDKLRGGGSFTATRELSDITQKLAELSQVPSQNKDGGEKDLVAKHEHDQQYKNLALELQGNFKTEVAPSIEYVQEKIRSFPEISKLIAKTKEEFKDEKVRLGERGISNQLWEVHIENRLTNRINRELSQAISRNSRRWWEKLLNFKPSEKEMRQTEYLLNTIDRSFEAFLKSLEKGPSANEEQQQLLREFQDSVGAAQLPLEEFRGVRENILVVLINRIMRDSISRFIKKWSGEYLTTEIRTSVLYQKESNEPTKSHIEKILVGDCVHLITEQEIMGNGDEHPPLSNFDRFRHSTQNFVKEHPECKLDDFLYRWCHDETLGFRDDSYQISHRQFSIQLPLKTLADLLPNFIAEYKLSK